MTEPYSKLPKYTTSDDDFADYLYGDGPNPDEPPRPIKRQIRTVSDLIGMTHPKVMKPSNNLRIQLLNRNLWMNMKTFVTSSQNTTEAISTLLPGHDFYQYYDYPRVRTIKPRRHKRFNGSKTKTH